MRLSVLGFILISLPLFAAETLSLRNDREGETIYSSRIDKRALSKAIREIDPSYIEEAYQEVLKNTNESRLCSFDITQLMMNKMRQRVLHFNELKGAILYLRTKNYFDDVVAKLLIQAQHTQSSSVTHPLSSEEISYPTDKTMQEALSLLKNFEKKLKLSCFDEAYSNLYGDILRVDKSVTSAQLATIFSEAAEQRIIAKETYINLEQGRRTDLSESSLTLKAYVSKIRSLRTQFPLRDPREKSNFVTAKVDKLKLSRRQKLFENYTDLQIILMANVIKKLKTRIEAPRIEILVHGKNEEVETISLEPMERFRFAIKVLRKEMALLALNSYFAGRSPDYMDLMTAAFETGMIPSSELEEVANLQDIWNPKKTLWEKSQTWARLASSVASIALPPPYGFIPALAIVVIEMTADKSKKDENDPTVLF
jgi:hypothetical protein